MKRPIPLFAGAKTEDEDPSDHTEDRLPASSEAEALTLALIEESIERVERLEWNAIGLSIDVRGRRLDALRALFDRHGLDLLVAPSASDEPELFFEHGGHWNEEGHERTAELPFRRLEDPPELLQARAR